MFEFRGLLTVVAYEQARYRRIRRKKRPVLFLMHVLRQREHGHQSVLLEKYVSALFGPGPALVRPEKIEVARLLAFSLRNQRDRKPLSVNRIYVDVVVGAAGSGYVYVELRLRSGAGLRGGPERNLVRIPEGGARISAGHVVAEKPQQRKPEVPRLPVSLDFLEDSRYYLYRYHETVLFWKPGTAMGLST